MHPAVRPMVSAGIALVGASVIAASTVAPPQMELQIADMPVASYAVHLTAAPNPFEFYPQVVGEALVNAAILAWDYVEIGPALAVALVTAPVEVLGAAVTTIGAVILLAPAFVFSAAQVIASPVLNGLGAAQVAFDDIANAVAASDVVDLVNAIVNIPGRIVDGVLNGGYPAFGGYDVGLFDYQSELSSGPLYLPLNFTAPLFGAAGMEPPFYRDIVAEPPDLQAATLTLTADQSLDSGSPPADLGPAETGPDPVAQDLQAGDTTVGRAGDVADGLVNATVDGLVQTEQGLDTAGKNADEVATAAGEPAADVAGGPGNVTTEPPAKQGRGLDPATTERTAGGSDLTDGNKVRPGQTSSKTPVRDTAAKAGTEIGDFATRVSTGVKKALSGGKAGAGKGATPTNGVKQASTGSDSPGGDSSDGDGGGSE